MLYRPRLGSGIWAQLAWPIACYRRLNTLCWPLEDDALRWAKAVDRLAFGFAVASFALHIDANVRYFVRNIRDLDALLQGLPTFLILLEISLRAFPLALRKYAFREFLRKFYAEIYIDKTAHPEMFGRIERSLRPAAFGSHTYLTTILLMFVIPAINIFRHGSRDPLYRMIVPFDHTSLHRYLLLIGANVHVGLTITSMQFGEHYILPHTMLHLNARYLLLFEDLQRSSLQLLESATDSAAISQELGKQLKRTIHRSTELNKFASEFHDFFTYRLFLMFSFAALIICALGFQVYTNPRGSPSSIFWLASKFIELLVLGEAGSTLMFTTADIGTMYYQHSNWEVAISRSSNARANIELMKVLLTAMTLNQKPFCLTGLGFVSATLSTVLKIFQGAFSYFTCLTSVR